MSGPIDAATVRLAVSDAVRADDPSSISVFTLKHLTNIAHSKHENVEPASMAGDHAITRLYSGIAEVRYFLKKSEIDKVEIIKET